MPYTPPAPRSPVSAGQAGTRRQDQLLSPPAAHQPPSSPNGRQPTSPSTINLVRNASSSALNRPGLARTSSASYLYRHRRSPSLSQAMASQDATFLNQAAQPASQTIANSAGISAGSMMSPPDSTMNSSDDDDSVSSDRRRELESLAELQAAIRVIEQHREGSPESIRAERQKARAALGLLVPPTSSAESNEVNGIDQLSDSTLERARRVSHSRSHTESAIADLPGPSMSDRSWSSSSDEDLAGHGFGKPPMLRKKSGELVRPALRGSSRPRPSSMPGTPMFGKAVHFDQQLEHVRHFLQVDRPLAVSAGSSPVETYEGDTEFPFGLGATSPREPPWEWEIRTPNLSLSSYERRRWPVHVERIFLSADKKNLIGIIAVQNLSFHKSVTVRFTLDFWKTTSELAAEYVDALRQRQLQGGSAASASAAASLPSDGCDRFAFQIRLEDQTKLEHKSMFFCVRYNVDGKEFWDNNGDINYQVDFAKKSRPQMGKPGFGRSTSPNARSNLDSLPRPVSMPSFDDFAHFDDEFGTFGPLRRAAHATDTLEMAPAPRLRIRNRPGNKGVGTEGTSTADAIVPDAPGLRSNGPAQAFGHRYDFGASLTAAKKAATTTTPTEKKPTPETKSTGSSDAAPMTTAGKGMEKPLATPPAKPGLSSHSYSELLDKYCFFGSNKSSATSSKGSSSVSLKTSPAVVSGSVTSSSSGTTSKPATRLAAVVAAHTTSHAGSPPPPAPLDAETAPALPSPATSSTPSSPPSDSALSPRTSAPRTFPSGTAPHQDAPIETSQSRRPVQPSSSRKASPSQPRNSTHSTPSDSSLLRDPTPNSPNDSPLPLYSPTQQSPNGLPSSPRTLDGAADERKSRSAPASHRASRSPSPTARSGSGSSLGVRAASPASFGFPFHHGHMEGGLFDARGPTAILG